MNMSNRDLEDLKYAKGLLENPSIASKLMDILGSPIEKGFGLLPERWSGIIQKATRISLEKALYFAIKTIGKEGRNQSRDLLHKIAVTFSGFVGGTFGLEALPVELPVSTTIMLRSICDIAKSEGENIELIETRLACLEVFALGGKSKKDNASETGYYVIRSALAKTVSEASNYIAEKGLVIEKGAPAIVKLITGIASRFGIVVSEKAAALAIPGIGALGAALINMTFMDHFQDMARGHFIVRRLERFYEKEIVQQEYARL